MIPHSFGNKRRAACRLKRLAHGNHRSQQHNHRPINLPVKAAQLQGAHEHVRHNGTHESQCSRQDFQHAQRNRYAKDSHRNAGLGEQAHAQLSLSQRQQAEVAGMFAQVILTALQQQHVTLAKGHIAQPLSDWLPLPSHGH